jgi:2-succinyl-5-enolpyruvyl-6-hydroxy-3-cyclohexene-1-carboxylate synthase
VNPADVQAAYCATLVDEWVRCGVTDAVVAPGSRSTPLLDALARDGRVRLHVVLDERAAGFMALGIGLASGSPALVVTTSGTAAVELHPAVVEAHQAGVPLVVLTADRPPELHGVGAPQTVDQQGLYGEATRFAADPGVPDLAISGAWRSLAARAVAEAVCAPAGPGPTHLNLAFREPLLASDELAADAAKPPGRPHDAPWHSPSRGRGREPESAVVELVVGPGRLGCIVAGEGAGQPSAVAELAAATGWPVLADPRSGCRVPDPMTVAAGDALLRVARMAELQPEVVVQLGAPPASKVLGQWLARPRPGDALSVLVDPYGRWQDPARRATHVVVADPTETCRALTAAARAAGPPRERVKEWADVWQRAEAAAQGLLDRQLQGPGLSEPGIARTVVGALRDGTTLVTASSMPVRDVEWWGKPRTGLRVLANRGANGIDGTVATALGVALAAGGQPVVALLGDLAFCYDAAALLWAPRRDVDCTLVVVDNDGGGIFSFLPQATALPAERFEALWATPHGLELSALAAVYGVAVSEVTTLDQLRAALVGGPPGRGVRVILARTSRRENVRFHAALHSALSAAVDAS